MGSGVRQHKNNTKTNKIMIDVYPQTINFSASIEADEVIFGPYSDPETPAAGELRWYGPDGTWTSVSASPGQLIAFGSEGAMLPLRNLNTTATLTSIFRDWNNFSVPSGIKFTACTNASYMFHSATGFTVAEQDNLFPVLQNMSYMFYAAKNTTIPVITSSSITNASYAFSNAQNLIVGAVDFSHVTNANYMFQASKNVSLPYGIVLRPTTADYCFQNSTFAFPRDMIFEPTGSAQWLFGSATRITQWPDNFKLDKATNLYTLFHDNSSNLVAGIPESITAESATNIEYMFNGTRVYDSVAGKWQRLQHLPSSLNLKSATSAGNFTSGCALDFESVKLIADTIKTHYEGTHNITIGINKALQYEHPEVAEQLQRIRDKRWTVTAQYNALL